MYIRLQQPRVKKQKKGWGCKTLKLKKFAFNQKVVGKLNELNAFNQKLASKIQPLILAWKFIHEGNDNMKIYF